MKDLFSFSRPVFGRLLSEFLTYCWLLLLLIVKWFELHYILGDRCGWQEGYCHIRTSAPNQAFSEDPGI